MGEARLYDTKTSKEAAKAASTFWDDFACPPPVVPCVCRVTATELVPAAQHEPSVFWPLRQSDGGAKGQMPTLVIEIVVKLNLKYVPALQRRDKG